MRSLFCWVCPFVLASCARVAPLDRDADARDASLVVVPDTEVTADADLADAADAHVVNVMPPDAGANVVNVVAPAAGPAHVLKVVNIVPPDADARHVVSIYARGDAGEPATNACVLAAAAPRNALAVAACRGIEAFARGEFAEPVNLLVCDVVARRFGVAALDVCWSRFTAAAASTPSAQLEVYARLGDASAQVTAEQLGRLEALDAFTIPALHCLEHALPSDYVMQLQAHLGAGDYDASHVLLALTWLREQGCADPTPAGVFETAIAALIDSDHSRATDLEIEAAALLAYLGRTDLAPAGFLEAVVRGQAASGGWSADGAGTWINGHTSSLALSYVHEALFPGRHTPSVNPYPRRATPLPRAPK